MKNIFSKILIALAVVAVMGFTGVSSALAYGDASIYCTGGGYFDKFGPSQYWTEFTSMGWCNAPAGNNWCENGQCAQNSPYNTVTRSMWRTYSGSQQSNYARWNMGNDGGYWYWFAFIPSNGFVAQIPTLIQKDNKIPLLKIFSMQLHNFLAFHCASSCLMPYT